MLRPRISTNLHQSLFITDNYQPLTRKVFIDLFRQTLCCIGFDDNLYNGYSFRIGAATSAASRNVEDHLIKTLGRWSSDAYCRYIRTPNSVLRNAQKSLI